MTPVTPDNVRALFGGLQVWERRGQRAPHKCLLALWAIGRCLSGESRMASYRLVDERLGGLLREFGPPRKAVHTEFPFWRLQHDGVWEIDRTDGISVTSSGDAHKTALLRANVHGGLIEDIYETLRANHRLAAQVASDLLAAHFPDSQHDDILQAVGIDPEFAAGKRRTMRDPGFRAVVLRAYEYRCAVCDFDVRIGARSVALDAAHIKWHQAGGPDEIRNGIALCVLHHKLFDAGAFTISQPVDGNVVLVSEAVVGTTGFDESLARFHKRPIRNPIRDTYRPEERFLAWNLREVFQSPWRA